MSKLFVSVERVEDLMGRADDYFSSKYSAEKCGFEPQKIIEKCDFESKDDDTMCITT